MKIKDWKIHQFKNLHFQQAGGIFYHFGLIESGILHAKDAKETKDTQTTWRL